MKWFRKIDIKVGLEVDFSYDSTNYQNDIFSVPLSEHQPISDVDLSSMPPVFYDDKYTSIVDYDIKYSDKKVNGGKELKKYSIENIEKFEKLSDFNNCTYHNINLKSIYKNSDSEFEI